MLSIPQTTSPAVWPLLIVALATQAPGQDIRPRSTLKGHTDFVYCVAVCPDGKSLASGARDGFVVCWDLDAARPRWTVKAHNDNGNGFTQVLSVVFSPDGKTIASGGWDCTVKFWDAASGRLKLTIPHENLVYSVAFSPDGTTLASAEHQTGIIHFWDVVTGKSTGVLESGRGSVWSVAFSSDGKTLASGGYVVRRNGGGVVRLWDLSERTLALEIPAQPLAKIALSSDGRRVAGTGYTKRAVGQQIDGLVQLWHTRTGELQRTWTVALDGRTSVGPVAFSPDGKLVAAGSAAGERTKERRKPGEIFLWQVASNRLVWRQSCHDDDVTCLAFTPDGKTLVSGGRDQAVKLWQIPQ
jgi:WD40 repeat protein